MYPSIELRGTHFRQPEEKEYASALSVGSRLFLVREPDNQFDMYAIKVVAKVGDTGNPDIRDTIQIYHLGYVAKESAMWIAPEMDAAEGEEIFFAIVTGFETRGKTTYPILSIGTKAEIEEVEKETEDFHSDQDEATSTQEQSYSSLTGDGSDPSKQ